METVEHLSPQERVMIRLDAFDRMITLVTSDKVSTPIDDKGMIALALRIEAYALYGERWMDHCV